MSHATRTTPPIPAEIRLKLDAVNPLISRQASRNGNLRGDERKLAALRRNEISRRAAQEVNGTTKGKDRLDATHAA